MYLFLVIATATTEIHTSWTTLSLHDALPIFNGYAENKLASETCCVSILDMLLTELDDDLPAFEADDNTDHLRRAEDQGEMAETCGPQGARNDGKINEAEQRSHTLAAQSPGRVLQYPADRALAFFGTPFFRPAYGTPAPDLPRPSRP